MINYMRFDSESFLKDSRRWDAEIKELHRELDAISELKAIEQSPTKSSSISNPTFNTAAERERILLRIEQRKMYQRALAYAYGCLSEPQKEVLDLFFYSKGYIPPLIEKYGLKHALCRSDVYKARREALDELSRIIEERYEL